MGPTGQGSSIFLAQLKGSSENGAPNNSTREQLLVVAA
jgi:hypothetical protein